MWVCFRANMTTVKYWSLTNHCLLPHLSQSFLIVSAVAFPLQLPGSKGDICYFAWPAGQRAKVAAVHWIYFHLRPLIIFQRVAHFLKHWIDSWGALLCGFVSQDYIKDFQEASCFSFFFFFFSLSFLIPQMIHFSVLLSEGGRLKTFAAF